MRSPGFQGVSRLNRAEYANALHDLLAYDALDATYELRVRARGPGAVSGQRFCAPPRVVVTLDGRAVSVDDPAALRLTLTGEPHKLSVALLDERRGEGVNELYGVYAVGGAIESVEIHGPFEATASAIRRAGAPFSAASPRRRRRDGMRTRDPDPTRDARISTARGFRRFGKNCRRMRAGVS